MNYYNLFKLANYFNKLAHGEELKPIVTIYPNHSGADIDEAELKKSELSVDYISADQCTFNEPESKVKHFGAMFKIHQMKKAIKKGEHLPPVVVIPQDGKYLIVDGHHRFTAYRQLKLDKIPAIIVSNDRVAYSDTYWQE